MWIGVVSVFYLYIATTAVVAQDAAVYPSLTCWFPSQNNSVLNLMLGYNNTGNETLNLPAYPGTENMLTPNNGLQSDLFSPGYYPLALLLTNVAQDVQWELDNTTLYVNISQLSDTQLCNRALSSGACPMWIPGFCDDVLYCNGDEYCFSSLYNANNTQIMGVCTAAAQGVQCTNGTVCSETAKGCVRTEAPTAAPSATPVAFPTLPPYSEPPTSQSVVPTTNSPTEAPTETGAPTETLSEPATAGNVTGAPTEASVPTPTPDEPGIIANITETPTVVSVPTQAPIEPVIGNNATVAPTNMTNATQAPARNTTQPTAAPTRGPTSAPTGAPTTTSPTEAPTYASVDIVVSVNCWYMAVYNTTQLPVLFVALDYNNPSNSPITRPVTQNQALGLANLLVPAYNGQQPTIFLAGQQTRAVTLIDTLRLLEAGVSLSWYLGGQRYIIDPANFTQANQCAQSAPAQAQCSVENQDCTAYNTWCGGTATCDASLQLCVYSESYSPCPAADAESMLAVVCVEELRLCAQVSSCETDDQCNDGLLCNGQEWCNNGTCASQAGFCNATGYVCIETVGCVLAQQQYAISNAAIGSIVIVLAVILLAVIAFLSLYYLYYKPSADKKKGKSKRK